MNEENYNTHLVQLKGKVVRDGKCPLKKTILCEDCEDYDGWGIDLKAHRTDIYCKNPRIIDSNKLTLIPMSNKKKQKRWSLFIDLIKGERKNGN